MKYVFVLHTGVTYTIPPVMWASIGTVDLVSHTTRVRICARCCFVVVSYLLALPCGQQNVHNSVVVAAQFLYVTLGMGPLFGTIAHHVLAERESGFMLMQQLCLLSPISYWASLFTADGIVSLTDAPAWIG